MENIIQIDGLCKSFGSVRAVRDVSFSVRRGELFAFLGINGAGKSTTISIMCDGLKKDSGRVLIDGAEPSEEPQRIHRAIGVVFQSSVLDSALTVRDNLESRAAMYGIKGRELRERIAELDELLELKDILGRTVGKLSGGQRRKADIARAIIHRPKLLILDEPTTGLDPQTRQRLWSVIDTLRVQSNMTVFLTTHYMEEAADADYVVILDAGRISAQGTPLELKNRYTGDFITVYGADEENVKALGKPYERLKGAFRISVANTAEATALILSSPALFEDYEITKGKMDDVFLAVTGKKLAANGTAEERL